MIVISYESRDLADRCTQFEAAQQWLGTTEAVSLIGLIADTEAMDNALALMEFYGISDRKAKSISIAVSPTRRAIFVPAGRTPEADADGNPQWQLVRRLKLIRLQDV